MDTDFYSSRLDKAKETLIAGRKEESSYRDSEHKKKKKHKDHRQDPSTYFVQVDKISMPSRSRSPENRDKKKREYSRSRDQPQHKHKKSHKHKDSGQKRHRHNDDRDRDHERRNRRSQEPNNRNRGGHDYERNRERRDYGPPRDNREPYYRRRDDRTVEEKDPYYQKRRDIQKVRRTDPTKAEEMETELEKQIIFDRKEVQLEEAKHKFKQAQKEMQEAKRQDMTIIVYCLPLKAKEKDIWNFFSKINSGKIRDIRIIRDARSGRSKGVAYVEFYNSESVQKSLTMTDMPFDLKGRQFMGLRVQHSQAQKNRAAAAAKQMRVIKPADTAEQQQEQVRRQTKVVVSGLVDKLVDISEKDLKELFEPFGQIDYVDIHRDPQTGACKGYAFIQFNDPQRAKVAVKQMNNLTVTNGQKITVQITTVQQRGEISLGEDFIYNTGTKNAMRGILSGAASTSPSYANLMRPPISTLTTPYLIITGMFKMEGTTPAYFDTLKKDMTKQAQEYGVIERVFIQKNNQGNVWIKFADTPSANKAQAGMNGKYYDNHKIFMYFVTQNTYQTRVGI